MISRTEQNRGKPPACGLPPAKYYAGIILLRQKRKILPLRGLSKNYPAYRGSQTSLSVRRQDPVLNDNMVCKIYLGRIGSFLIRTGKFLALRPMI